MIGWMRLDTDFYRDEKFLAIARLKGKAAAFDAVRLYCLCHQKYGSLDLNDPITRGWAEEELGLKGKRLDAFLEDCAECRLISADMLGMGVVTSDRLSEEGMKRRDTEDKRAAAGKRSGKSRREQAMNKCSTSVSCEDEH